MADRHSYVSFYPSDWLAGMAFMPPIVEWLYLQICLFNWDKRAPLPANEARLRLSRSPTWEADLEALLSTGKVIKTTSGAVFVPRAIAEAEKAYELWEKKSRGGRAKKMPENQGQAQQSSNTLGKSEASNQNQNQNQTIPIGIDPPTPQGGFAGDLLFSVPDEAMRNFRAHRRAIKAPLSPHAEKLLLQKLEDLHRQGHDPVKVLDQSILNGWRGVFELKGNDHGTRADNGRNGLLKAALE